MNWVLILTTLAVVVYAPAPKDPGSRGRQGHCRNPAPGLQVFCNSLSAWDDASRDIDVPTGTSRLPALANGDQMSLQAISPGAIPPTKYDCLNWQCVCNFEQGASWDGSSCNLQGGGSLSNRQRSEMRTLSSTYLARYAAGFRAAYNAIYSTLSNIHSNVNLSPGAHSGPAFLPWHREFCKRMEIGIRTVRVNGVYPYWDITIPYWDNSLDRNTQFSVGNSPFDTMMFSRFMMGSVRTGTLTDGLFGGWSGNLGSTQRSVGTSGVSLMTASDINNMVSTHTVNQVLAATTGGGGCPSLPFNTLELMHGNPHVFIGRDMSVITRSTNDPVFFNHHSFIDCVWEEWRLLRQSPSARETQYNTASTSCYSSAHRANAIMQPFSNGGFINTDGLSNLYTQNFYTYAPRPTANNCPGPYLVVIAGRCCVRLKPFASCRRIGGVDPCYASTCSSTNTNWGTCSAPTSDVPEVPVLPPVKADDNPNENCFNNHECCAMWAEQGECKKNPAMLVACKAACGVCTLKRKCKDNCSDRHQLCKMFKEEGKCEKNPYFMNENCRKTCGACGKKRSEICSDPNYKLEDSYAPSKKKGKSVPKKGKTVPVKAPPPKNKPVVSGCYNANVCCEHWKGTVGCSKMGILTKVCQASCLCKPKYDISSCNDFLKTCAAAKKEGLCKLDQIKENCRKTCGSCADKTYLAKKC